MNSLWDNLYDRFKDRRYGALFLACLLAIFGFLILVAISGMVVNQSDLQGYFLTVAPVLAMLAIVRIALVFRTARRRRWERHKYPPLSRDELRVARSKLMKERKKQV